MTDVIDEATGPAVDLENVIAKGIALKTEIKRLQSAFRDLQKHAGKSAADLDKAVDAYFDELKHAGLRAKAEKVMERAKALAAKAGIEA